MMDLASMIDLVDLVKALIDEEARIIDYGFDSDGKSLYVVLSDKTEYIFTVK